MNYNPLLVKNFLIGKIPFIKERTTDLYGEYISNRKFSKVISSEDSETLSAYSMFNNYVTNFIFDEGDITTDTHFSEKEWNLLGLFLRALSEVENVNLMHLYNCLYNYEGVTIKGSVVTGRTYTLYSSSRLGLEIYIKDFYNRPLEIELVQGPNDYPEAENPGIQPIPKYSEIKDLEDNYLGIRINSISKSSPVHFKVKSGENPEGILVNISIKFEAIVNILTSLVEGNYSGLDNLGALTEPYSERRLIPENLKIGEYSRKLVEFFSGTLVTPLSDPKLRANLSRDLIGNDLSFEKRVIENTPGIYNKDGYMDRRVDL